MPTPLSEAIATATATANPSIDPRARSWQERLMNWWQANAGAPQSQAYDPRAYPPRRGLIGGRY